MLDHPALDLLEESEKRVRTIDEEMTQHIHDKAEAYHAVKEVLDLCKHDARDWKEFNYNPELRDFKRKVSGILEMDCLNLGSGTRGITKGHILDRNGKKLKAFFERRMADNLKSKNEAETLAEKELFDSAIQSDLKIYNAVNVNNVAEEI